MNDDVRPIWAVVAGRMGSSRAPGKTMAMLAGRPSLWHIMGRLGRMPVLDGVVVATTSSELDDPIRACARDAGVPCYSGSADDVLGRTLAAARSVGAQTIVQVTGDNPLVDAELVGDAVAAFCTERPDYVSNRLHAMTYPDGYDVEVFPVSVLSEVDSTTQDPLDREHVTTFVYAHPERYRLIGLEAAGHRRRPELYLSVDTSEEVELMQAIYAALWRPDQDFGIDDVLGFLDENPHLARVAARAEP